MVYLVVSILFLIVGFAAVAGFAVLAFSLMVSNIYGAPYVPIEKKNLKAILELGGLKNDDVICDLGSGDGRVLLEAVSGFGVSKGIGYEASVWPYYRSILKLRSKKLGDRVKIFRKNFLKEDGRKFNDVSLVYAYTYPPLMKKISSTVLPNLKKGSRVIAVSFSIPDENKDFKLIRTGDAGWHKVFIYEKIG